MNRPVEDYAIGVVMAEQLLNRLLAEGSGLQNFYTLLLASGWQRGEIAGHRGIAYGAVSYQMYKLLGKIKSGSGVI